MSLMRGDARTSRLILASASRTRAALLSAAGVTVDAIPASVDEAALRDLAKSRNDTTETTALFLAEAKALAVGEDDRDALVIGADQMLECEGAWFEKADNRAEAADSLRRLRGRAHRLVSAVVVAEAGNTVWHATETATLVMRSFDDAFLGRYLDAVGDDALASVGAYRLEGLGVQLFERIEGDHFTILGLPLLALLDFLRRRGVLDS